MRSRAVLSAARASREQAFSAAPISSGVTLSPTRSRSSRSRSSRSNFSVYSLRARSPRAATSARIARTTASTSAAVSRLVSRKARNFCAKSAERVSRRIAMKITCVAGDAYQQIDIITILIFGFLIDKKSAVAALLEYTFQADASYDRARAYGKFITHRRNYLCGRFAGAERQRARARRRYGEPVARSEEPPVRSRRGTCTTRQTDRDPRQKP